jgi:hypothetical protein
VQTDGRNLKFDRMSWDGSRQGVARAFDLNPPTP